MSVSDLFRDAEGRPIPIEYSGGYVYVLMLMCPGRPVFKIGMAREVSSRMDAIQPMLPFDSYLLFTFWHEDPLGQEAYMHHYYAEYRLNGEWFNLPLETLLELERWGEIMAAKTPPGKLSRAPNWRRVLRYNAPDLLLHLAEEFRTQFFSGGQAA